jgi:threonylcarbamoyladenosine tRNA methylthiotransferase MtaB
MAKVALETVGCRLNQYETEQLADKLVRMGLHRVRYDQEADLYILNSCTVTGKADADCRALLNRIHRRNRNAIMVLTGCYAASEKQKVIAATGVDLVIGNDDKERLPQIIKELYPNLFDLTSETAGSYEPATPLPIMAHEADHDGDDDYPRRNRALIKIGDGCDQACTYCIVPRVRGRLTSLPVQQIIEDVNRLVGDGYHEVVLTAVHIGGYQYEGVELAGLIHQILDRTPISRLRLSSLEPNELDDPLLDLVAHHWRVCRHLHLPLQSGSDRILRLMKRPYSHNDYLGVLNRVKQANPDITIGCDLIVGFPGENDDDFAASLEILQSGAIDYQHTFSYSDRPGTPASKFPGKVPPQIVKERNRVVRETGRISRRRQMATQVGKVLGTISENKIEKEDYFWGITDNYLKVKIPAVAGGKKEIIPVKISRVTGDHMEGDLA